MSHQTTWTPAEHSAQSFDRLPAYDRASSDENVTESASPPADVSRMEHFAQTWSASQVFLTFSIPLIALAAWLGRKHASPLVFNSFAGEQIGGRFSQPEAKAVDVITGAILAPLCFAALNHVWFDSARVSAVNEQHRKALPLRTVAAASGTTEGSYNLFLLRDLFRGRTWRLSLFGLLTLLSAVARTAFSNVIAYEAYTEKSLPGDTVTLRLQRDLIIEKSTSSWWARPGFNLYDFTAAQNAEVAKKMTSLLTDLSVKSSMPTLTNNTYSIVDLINVPAYRLSVDCRPDTPVSLHVRPLDNYNTEVSVLFNQSFLSVGYPGVPAAMQTGDDRDKSYVAFFPGIYDLVYLGHLERSRSMQSPYNLENKTTSTMFGDVQHRVLNITYPNTKNVTSVSGGLRCVLYREQGVLNATRIPTNESSIVPWSIVSTDFPKQPSKERKKLVPSMLGRFQLSALNFHAPSAVCPGLGPALSEYGRAWEFRDLEPPEDLFTPFALRYLYASAEAERIIYDVAASSTKASHHRPSYFVEVKAFSMQQHYRMTYVPSVLLLGLLCLLGASLVTGAMAAYTRKSVSARAHRKVNVMRLLVDSVLGLEDEKVDMAKATQSDNRDLDTWAAGYKVRYTSKDDKKGTMQIVLEKVEE